MSTLFPEGAADVRGRGQEAETTLEILRRRSEIADIEAKRAKATLDAAERSKTFWAELVDHFARDEVGSVLLQLDRNREYVEQLRAHNDPAGPDVESLRNEADAVVRHRVKSLGRAFPEAARSAGLVIDSSSRHPKYTFQDGFVRLEFDEKRLVAKLQIREAEEKEYGLDLDLVVRVLRDETARLFDREFKPDAFLRSLFTAYSAELRSERLSEGTEVPIRRVTHRLGKNLSRFSGDEFNVDLARAMRAGKTTIEGRKLHLNHTRNTRQGMLLHGLEQGGYVGFISFKGEEPK